MSETSEPLAETGESTEAVDGSGVSADVVILHNPACSTSRRALAAAGAVQLGTGVEVVHYLQHPLDEAGLRALLAKLIDPPTDLVRRDSYFSRLGLTAADVATPDQIVAVLCEHPRLMQRPVLIRGERAIIGRPPERVVDFLAE